MSARIGWCNAKKTGRCPFCAYSWGIEELIGFDNATRRRICENCAKKLATEVYNVHGSEPVSAAPSRNDSAVVSQVNELRNRVQMIENMLDTGSDESEGDDVGDLLAICDKLGQRLDIIEGNVESLILEMKYVREWTQSLRKLEEKVDSVSDKLDGTAIDASRAINNLGWLEKRVHMKPKDEWPRVVNGVEMPAPVLDLLGG